MSQQQDFQFAPPVGPVDRVQPPFQGTSELPLHASYTGSVHATQARGEKISALRQLLKNHGPLTLNDCAVILRYPLSSICSLKAALGDDVVPMGLELKAWDHGRQTRRTLWGLR